MNNIQSGILESTPPVSRYLIFSLTEQGEARKSLRALCDIADGRQTIVGLGQSLVLALGATVPGLRTFPSYAGAGLEVPSTPFALWCWLRGNDRGELLHRVRRINRALAPAFRLDQVIDAFTYGTARDLTGYEDGTENPKDERALEVAFVQGQGNGLDGSSFVAVQQWVHDLDRFDAKSTQDQDNTIGRRRSDNDEIEDAPPSAHVKRATQEKLRSGGIHVETLDAVGGQLARRTGLCRVWCVLRRVRGHLEADGRRGRRDSGRIVHIHPSDIGRLFLVSRHTRRTIGSTTAWRVARPCSRHPLPLVAEGWHQTEYAWFPAPGMRKR